MQTGFILNARKNTIKYVLGIVIFIFFCLFVVAMLDNNEWSEWQLQGETPLCGSGVKVYKKKCSLGGLAKMFGRQCETLIDGDTKTEEYSLGKCPIIGRYVIIERVGDSIPVPVASNDDNAINLADVFITDNNGNNLIDDKSVATTHTAYSMALGASNLLDNNHDTFAHTKRNDLNHSVHWFKIDLQTDKQIGKITLRNRKGTCCKYRLAGVRIRVTDNLNADVYTSPIILPTEAQNVNLAFVVV
jgi:hypothetical protein